MEKKVGPSWASLESDAARFLQRHSSHSAPFRTRPPNTPKTLKENATSSNNNARHTPQQLSELLEEKDRLVSQERYLKRQITRLIKSRENIQLEALSLQKKLEQAESELAESHSKTHERLKRLSNQHHGKEEKLMQALQDLKENEKKAKRAARRARQELETMARAPWREMKQTVERLVKASEAPLKNAADILNSADQRAREAEYRAAKLQEQLCVAKQLCEMERVRATKIAKAMADRQEEVEALRLNDLEMRETIATLKEKNAALQQEVEKQTMQTIDLERKLRLSQLID